MSLLALFGITYSQSWENISPFGPGIDLKGITENVFDSSLWICGDDGLLAKSEDEGETWEYFPNSLGDYSNAQMLYFLSEKDVICISNTENLRTIPNESKVYKSTDGCASWELVYIGENEIYSIDFADENIGFISGRIVLKTIDGGTTWTEESFSATQIQFVNPSLAYAIEGSSVFKTLDQFETLQEIFTNEDYQLRAFHFTSEGIGLVSVFKSEDYSPNDWRSKVLQTPNGGLDWVEYDFGNTFQNTIVLINSFYSENDDTVWGTVNLDKIVRFYNKGTSWDVLSKGNEANSSSMISSGQNVVVVGADGTITKSKDSGAGWYNISIGNTDFYDVQFINRNIGFASGRLTKEYNYYPFLIKSDNGGDDWIELNVPLDDVQDIDKIYFLDELNGYLLVNNVFGSRSKILKTVDGGETWKTVYDIDIAGEQLNDLQFLDSSYGIAVGSGTTIVKTTTGGANWTWTTRNSSVQIVEVEIINKDVSYFGGIGLGSPYNEGQFLLLYSDNSAITYDNIISNITDISRMWDVKDMQFFDSNNGWALLGYELQDHGVLFKTNDGGLSWTRNYVSGNIEDNFTTICFLDSTIGYVSKDGCIFSTQDGGGTWKENLIEYYPYRANSIDFIDQTFGVIAGMNNMLLRTEDDLNVSIEESLNKIISQFNLAQNYPNPFNPTTKIKYSIPNVGNENFRSVQLKVYDVLGKEVATLVNKEQSAGSYEVEFDSNELTSGIYFYQLRAGSLVETKKMILLR